MRVSLVEKQVRLGRVAVDPLLPVQHLERHQGVEKVASRSFMKAELRSERSQVGWRLGECREHSQLDGAQERLGCPKAHSEPENVIRCGVRHGAPHPCCPCRVVRIYSATS